jgi:hypothetical protein
MPTPKRPTETRPTETEDSAAPKTTRRRTSATSQPTDIEASHDASRNVTEAKPPASATAPQTLPVSETPRNAEEEIRRRAYELYEQDGRQHGRDREHWLRAEAEVVSRSNEHSAGKNERDRRGQKSA